MHFRYRFQSTVAALALLTIAAAPCRLDGARIFDTGSTNAQGYTIALHSDGTGWWRPSSRMGQPTAPEHTFTIAQGIARRFLDALSDGRAQHVRSVPCMKSASFGHSVFAIWHGWRSPDITCPLDSAGAQRIAAGIHAVIAASGMPAPTVGRRIGLPGNEPRRQPSEPSPAGSATPQPRSTPT
ncbi:MAG: hypothetical protein HKL92_08230 [Candidatus Eremiobacteraeota bacterium]|nr:hypothetical protein [Candidatus Eremiobacteraeota bacterium]NNM93314.1 hypothetical protein [Candidatus Eremiobacteraeota bacterium]